MKRILVLFALVAPVALLRPSPARAEPTDRELAVGGAVLAVPDYFVGVTLHEGSHALAARLMGSHVRSLHLYPGVNPLTHHFQFGWTVVDHLPQGTGSLVLFYGAPKLTDLAMLGGYATLYFTHSLPKNGWAWLPLQVLATGFWVDFAKDVVIFHPYDDVVRIFDTLGWHTELARLPARLVYLAADVGLGYLVYLGIRDLFRSNNATVAPLYTMRF